MVANLPTGTTTRTLGSPEVWDVIDSLYECRWLVVACMFLAALTAAAHLFFAVPVYEADALLQVEADADVMDGLSVGQAEEDAVINAEIELITSRRVLAQVVQRQRLTYQAAPRYFPVIGAPLARRHDAAEGLATDVLGLEIGADSPYAWGGESIELERFEIPDSWLNQAILVRAKADGKYDLVFNELLVGEGRKGELFALDNEEGLIRLLVTDFSARPGTEFVLTRKPLETSIVDLFDRIIAREESEGAKMIRLRLRGRDPVEVQQTLMFINRFYLREKRGSRTDQNERAVEFLEEQLPALRAEMEDAEDALVKFQQESASVNLELETKAIVDRVAHMQRELSDLRNQREEASNRYLPDHPRMVALEARIANTQLAISSLEQGERNLPEVQRQYLRLSRDLEVKTQLYTELLNRLQAMKVARNVQPKEVRIIDEALTRPAPISPRRSLIIALYLVLGGLVATAAVYARRKIFGGLDNPSRIESLFGLPVCAIVPRADLSVSDKHSTPLLVSLDDPSNPAAEALRKLRVTMRFTSFNASNNIVAITGPTPGVGKSFVASNLAVLLAQSGTKVVLIDADLRRGSIHSYFGLDRGDGLSNAIVSDKPAKSFIRSIEGVDNLGVMTTGDLPPNPSELLMSDDFAKLLEGIKADTILIDTAPILAVADPIAVNMLAGATLLILKSGEHSLVHVDRCVNTLHQANANLRGFVLNDVTNLSARTGYGPYYAYGDQNYTAAANGKAH